LSQTEASVLYLLDWTETGVLTNGNLNNNQPAGMSREATMKIGKKAKKPYSESI
jgi:hypothetical protein